MLGWALTFLVIALIAALLGFGGIAGTAVGIAKIIFFVAIILFLISADRGSDARPRGLAGEPELADICGTEAAGPPVETPAASAFCDQRGAVGNCARLTRTRLPALTVFKAFARRRSLSPRCCRDWRGGFRQAQKSACGRSRSRSPRRPANRRSRRR